MRFTQPPKDVLQRLRTLRTTADAPTRGGRVLSYVYDTGREELDTLADAAALEVLHLNGLDPFVFGSIATMERDVVAFVRSLLNGDAAEERVVGTVTSGGTESVLLAVLAARELAPGKRRIVAPATRHPAFAKAAKLLGLDLAIIPVDEAGRVDDDAFVAALDDDVVLAVLSAPSYPSAALDPIGRLAPLCAAAGVDVHVDACFGGLALPFWPGVPAWDFRVPGVVSISADLHKFGYSPKGASVLLQRGEARQRAHFFADVDWPGYPVATSTLLGSRQPAGLAAAWAVMSALGEQGFADLMRSCVASARAIHAGVASIDGLHIVGEPVGPALAVAADGNAEAAVDPLLLTDALRTRGFYAQAQPAFVQAHGPTVPASMHLTITPALEANIDALIGALREAADEVRGGVASAPAEMAAALQDADPAALGPEAAHALLQRIGADEAAIGSSTATLMALIARAPRAVSERLLVELLAQRLGDGAR